MALDDHMSGHAAVAACPVPVALALVFRLPMHAASRFSSLMRLLWNPPTRRTREFPGNINANLTVPDDSRLMQEISVGSSEAFEELYRRFHARAYRVAWSVCRNDGRAEVAVQDGFMAIWRSARNYRTERGAVASWLLALVHNRAVDVARDNTRHTGKRAQERKAFLHAVPDGVVDRVEDRDDAARLKALVQLLPKAQQEVIALAFYGQLTHAEIAEQLQLPPGTVKGRMRLGLHRLRSSIDEAAVSERLRVALVRAFLAGELGDARRVMRTAVTEMPVVTMLDDVLAPAMHSIGGLWRADQITVADEHLATSICHRLLAEISPALQSAPADSRETVLLLCPERERHTLGLLMVDAVLHGAGYRTLLLGNGVPGAALSAALLRHQPAVVALSSTVAPPASLVATANLIHETLPPSKLITGGATARQLPQSITAHYVARLDGLLDVVDVLLGPSR
jgi:RNA polymerase sigma-70 factor (ECF subfamily)